MSEVSIVIPIDWVEECRNSVLKQRFNTVEESVCEFG